MTVSEITLIYFSIGAPFAVYEIVRSRSPLTIARSATAAAAFFIWPLSAFRMLRRRFRTGPASKYFARSAVSDLETADPIDSIRESMTSIGAANYRGTSVFRFREIFDRYVGLTLAANPKYLDSSAPHELFKISGRVDAEIAEMCLNRRNRAKLSRHQTKARESFLEFIDNLPDLSQRTEAAKLALELAYRLNDGPAVGHLENFLKSARTTEGVIWNSDKQQHIQTSQPGLPALSMTPRASRND